MHKAIWVAIGKMDPSSQNFIPLNAPFLSDS